MKNAILSHLEEVIRYRFNSQELLRQALTHSSYTNEHHMPRSANNERLEFLGDAVLELVTSEYLFFNHAEEAEGELTRIRASIVCEPTLAFCTREINLGQYLLIGKGEELTGGRERASILSDALEALIAAIFLDGGITSAKEFVKNFILNDLDSKKLFFDSKTILQEYMQKTAQATPVYQLIDESGPDHDRSFRVNVCLEDTILGCGVGRTKKAAEQEAAYHALLKFKRNL